MSLQISSLNAGYGRQQILHDVSIDDMKSGEMVGVIGPNAAGKSTFFKSLTGIVRPRSGYVSLDDQDILSMRRKQRARQVAYMPQSIGCNAALTVFESVLLALKQTTGWRVGADHLNRVSNILSMLGLCHLADRGIGALSGGQSQMVAVAQVLVRKPKLLLLDEPTSALDLHHQLSILSAIRDAAKEFDIIVMAALHDLNLAAKFCDRLVLIREGRVLADGEPREILGLEALNETYRIRASIEKSSLGTYYVDAQLP